MISDINAVTRTTTGTAAASRSRLRAIYVVHTATAGSIVFRDGGAGGATRLDLATVATDITPNYLNLPGDGILFRTDMHVTLTNITSATFFYTE